MGIRVDHVRRTAFASKPLLGGLAAAGLLVIALTLFLNRGVTSSTAPVEEASFALVEFGAGVDTVWKASTSQPERRTKLFEIHHADQFGAITRLSPDRSRFAYLVLPPETPAPSPDSPANLWLASLDGGTPELLAQDADLLVAPVWSRDGVSLVYRRSSFDDAGDPAGYRLLAVDAGSKQGRELVFSGEALFPVSFTPSGDALYYVKLSATGSELWSVATADTTSRFVALLSENLTRDWTISPAGDRLAFLALSITAEVVASRAMILDLASGAIADAGNDAGDEFSPVWSEAGELALGRVSPGKQANPIAMSGTERKLSPPKQGFDAPVGWSPAGDWIAVRSFESSSPMAPGRVSIVLVNEKRGRLKVGSGEVTFLGWIR